MNEHDYFMQVAIKLSIENVDKGGGPFGAVVVKDGKIIAKAANSVTLINDPTAHAEVNAIRLAAKELGTFDLSGCILYTSCEPCPMCLGAIYWARIDKVYYANTKDDARDINFDDAFIYEEILRPMNKRHKPFIQIMREQALEAFKKWEQKEDKIPY